MIQETADKSGLERNLAYLIMFQKIIDNGGSAEMSELYDVINNKMNENNYELSENGRASLRAYINGAAVNAGYIFPHDPNNTGWKITQLGRDFVKNYDKENKEELLNQEEIIDIPTEETFNEVTQKKETKISNIVKGTEFEKFVGKMMKVIYPDFCWYDQGCHKKNERGLDWTGNQFPGNEIIGVQAKFVEENSSPTELYWLKFLAGCQVRHITIPIFITTGKLTSDQSREAGEGRIKVISGREEINRICELNNIELFNFEDYEQ